MDRTTLFETEALPHLALIYRAASRLLGDPGRADDITQNVFLNAWRCFDRYEPGTNCRAWLFRILFHCIQHYHRRERPYSQNWIDRETFFACLPATTPVPERLNDRHLIQLLNQLHPRQRETMLLVDVEEYTYREAADRLQIPIGTVMSRLSRARAHMRTLLQDPSPHLPARRIA